jgi:hypothetical protein
MTEADVVNRVRKELASLDVAARARVLLVAAEHSLGPAGFEPLEGLARLADELVAKAQKGTRGGR